MKKQVLIVDDDEEMCEELADILRQEGYFVRIVFNGIDGQKNIRKNIYDLALLDIKMSGINGLEILKYAKEANIKAKIIILTGSLSISQLLGENPLYGKVKYETILKLADCVIPKPFDVDKLLATIKSLL